MNQDLKLIKKHYGEKMAHLCRELFSTLLEEEGLLFKLISSTFGYSKNLYDDIVMAEADEAFKNLIYSFLDDEPILIDTHKSPFELMDEAGYKLFECNSEEDIQEFRKYYRSDEELCTFRGGRLKDCYVFFAVKKDVGEINRDDFKKPKRQDLYGTSVISIQFTRGSNNVVSIKNRYNHTVSNPDATFSNNLDNIIPGLTKSFMDAYDFNIAINKSNFDLSNYVKARDGRYYRYNYEIDNIYYCENNIIISNHDVLTYFKDKSKYFVFDYFILDLQNKMMHTLDVRDTFIDQYKNIKKIEIVKDKNDKIISIEKNDGISYIKVNEKNQMIGYYNDYIKEIKDDFLVAQENLEEISLDGATSIGNYFMGANTDLYSLSLPNVETIEDDFLFSNNCMRKVDLPNVRKIGNYFMGDSIVVEEVNMPLVEEIKGSFLLRNNAMDYIFLPSVKRIGPCFLEFNHILNSLYMPMLEEVDISFLQTNMRLQELNLPSLKYMDRLGLYNNDKLKRISLPSIEFIGEDCFSYVDSSILDEVNINVDVSYAKLKSEKTKTKNYKITYVK